MFKLAWPFGTKNVPRGSTSPEIAFHGDLEIKDESLDLLDRSRFVDVLARALLHNREGESLVFALRGRWGKGKSSVVELVVKSLAEKYGRQNIIRFTPWRYGDDISMSEGFYRELRSGIHGKGRYTARKLLNKILKRLEGGIDHLLKPGQLLYLMAAVVFGGTAIGIEAFRKYTLTGLPTVSHDIFIGVACISVALLLARTLVVVFQDILPEQSLYDLRENLKNALKINKSSTIFIIDELDRIEPSQVKLVLKHVLANRDLPHVNYLLVYHKEVLERIFYEYDIKGESGYLDKFIQIAFDMPEAEGDRVAGELEKEIRKKIQQYWHEGDGDRFAEGWVNFSELFLTIRDVRRFIDALSIQIELHKPNGKLEVNVVDLCIVTALKLLEPLIHKHICVNRKKLAAAKSVDWDVPDESLSRLNRDSAFELLRVIFPKYGRAGDDSQYTREHWADAKRICSDLHSDKYFELRVPDRIYSEREFLTFLQNSADNSIVVDFLDRCVEEGKLDWLCRRLQATGFPVSDGGAANILAKMGEMSDRQLSNADNKSFLAIVNAAQNVVKNAAHDIRQKAIESVASQAPLAFAGELLAKYYQWGGFVDIGLRANELDAARNYWSTRFFAQPFSFDSVITDPINYKRWVRLMFSLSDTKYRDAWVLGLTDGNRIWLVRLMLFVLRALSLGKKQGHEAAAIYLPGGGNIDRNADKLYEFSSHFNIDEIEEELIENFSNSEKELVKEYKDIRKFYNIRVRTSALVSIDVADSKGKLHANVTELKCIDVVKLTVGESLVAQGNMSDRLSQKLFLLFDKPIFDIDAVNVKRLIVQGCSVSLRAAPKFNINGFVLTIDVVPYANMPQRANIPVTLEVMILRKLPEVLATST